MRATGRATRPSGRVVGDRAREICSSIDRLLLSGKGFEEIHQDVVSRVKSEFGVCRANFLFFNPAENMLEATSAVGQPNRNIRDFRIPLIMTTGSSFRAAASRCLIMNKPVLVTDRADDIEYRLRDKYPHKSYSREFGVVPVTFRRKKLGVLSVAVTDKSSLKLDRSIMRDLESVGKKLAEAIWHSVPQLGDLRLMDGYLSEILNKGLLQAHYQPIVDMNSMTIFGYECLSRPQHPIMNRPAMMFEIAEKFNRRRDLSYFCHKLALKALPRLRRGRKLFVNFHPKDFEEYIASGSRSNPFHGKDFTRLVLEVTERSYIEAPRELNAALEFYRKKGAAIAIDDLGSGYSALDLLAVLEPDFIKLDISLVRDVHKNDKKLKLLKTLFYYAGQIKCRTVSEGIENIEDLEAVRRAGGDLAQGFFLARPDPKLLASLPASVRNAR